VVFTTSAKGTGQVRSSILVFADLLLLRSRGLLLPSTSVQDLCATLEVARSNPVAIPKNVACARLGVHCEQSDGGGQEFDCSHRRGGGVLLLWPRGGGVGALQTKPFSNGCAADMVCVGYTPHSGIHPLR